MRIEVDLPGELGKEGIRGDQRTQILLLSGVVGAVLFYGILLIEGALRPGYAPDYHVGSALSLGERGWIQIVNFLLLGFSMLPFAVGLRRTLGDSIGASLVAVFGLGIIASGLFPMDPMRGYPPGTPPGTPEVLSWHHQIHNAAGPLAFIALFAGCLALSRRLRGGWRLYTLLTAATGLALTAWTGTAWLGDAANTGLVQRGLIFVYLSWIALLGARLASRLGAGQRRIGAPPIADFPHSGR